MPGWRAFTCASRASISARYLLSMLQSGSQYWVNSVSVGAYASRARPRKEAPLRPRQWEGRVVYVCRAVCMWKWKYAVLLRDSEMGKL